MWCIKEALSEWRQCAYLRPFLYGMEWSVGTPGSSTFLPIRSIKQPYLTDQSQIRRLFLKHFAFFSENNCSIQNTFIISSCRDIEFHLLMLEAWFYLVSVVSFPYNRPQFPPNLQIIGTIVIGKFCPPHPYLNVIGGKQWPRDRFMGNSIVHFPPIKKNCIPSLLSISSYFANVI